MWYLSLVSLHGQTAARVAGPVAWPDSRGGAPPYERLGGTQQLHLNLGGPSTPNTIRIRESGLKSRVTSPVVVEFLDTVFAGASWQRCRVHFMRNVLTAVPKAAGPMVASIIRTIFAQPDTEHVFTQFHEVVRMLTRSHPKVADMLEDAKDDLLAFCQFPFQHWRQIWSTNPLERVNKEIKRRTDVVGTFPNPAALLRLAGHVLIEQHDEWDGGDRRYFSEHSVALLLAETEEVSIPELTAA